MAVFAVRVDTFPAEKHTAVFYIGTNDTKVLTELRRHMLGSFEQIPISGEYIHRTAFDIAAKYGKDTFKVSCPRAGRVTVMDQLIVYGE